MALTYNNYTTINNYQVNVLLLFLGDGVSFPLLFFDGLCGLCKGPADSDGSYSNSTILRTSSRCAMDPICCWYR